MDNAIELAARFKCSVSAVEGLADWWDIPLSPLSFEPDSYFNRAAHDFKRGNLSSFAIAYWLDCILTDDSGAKVELLEAVLPDKSALQTMWLDLGRVKAKSETLPGAKLWLDRASAAQADPAALAHIGQWCQTILAGADGEKPYLYLAVRLMLSLPEADRPNYPKIIQSSLNRVRHHGYLTGWFRVDRDEKGRGKTCYHAKAAVLDL